jgi:hypothetical protein
MEDDIQTRDEPGRHVRHRMADILGHPAIAGLPAHERARLLDDLTNARALNARQTLAGCKALTAQADLLASYDNPGLQRQARAYRAAATALLTPRTLR